jgi:hypothetical protein
LRTDPTRKIFEVGLNMSFLGESQKYHQTNTWYFSGFVVCSRTKNLH